MTTKAGRPIDPNSILRTEGGTKIIRIGKASYDRLQRLAGDDTITATVSRLTKEALKDNQGSLGSGIYQSENTIASLKSEVKELKTTLSSLIEVLKDDRGMSTYR